MAAPTLSANNGIAATTAATAAFTSVSWVTGDLILVAQVEEGATSESFATAPTATGLTFTNLITHAAASDCGLAVWQATAASNGSGVITATHPNAGNPHWNAWVWVWHSHGGLGNTATQFTSTETVSLTPAGGAHSAIVWVVGDWSAASSPVATPTTPNVTTRQATKSGTAYTYTTADSTDQTSAGAVSYGVNYTSSGPFSIAVVEIKGTGAGSAPFPPILHFHRDGQFEPHYLVNF